MLKGVDLVEAVNQKGTVALPKDMIKNIYSFLDHKCLLEASKINKLWMVVAVETEKQNEFNLMQKFASFLLKRLNLNVTVFHKIDGKPEDLNNDECIDYSSWLRSSQSLEAIKLSILKIRELIIRQVLLNLDDLRTNVLEATCRSFKKPALFENIFTITRIWRALRDERTTFIFPKYMSLVIKEGRIELLQIFVKNGAIDKAIAIVPPVYGSELREIHPPLEYTYQEIMKNGEIGVVPNEIRASSIFLKMVGQCRSNPSHYVNCYKLREEEEKGKKELSSVTLYEHS